MKNPHNISNLLLPIGFSLLLLSPMVNDGLALWEFERNSENRNFADSLSVNINELDYFPEDCEKYLNDNFSFRTPLLDLYHHLKFNVLHISPHIKKTLIGKNNWFFIGGNERNIYEGFRDFTDQALDSFLVEWKYRQRYFNSKGIKIYWMVAPIKYYVYEEYVPDHIFASGRRRLDQIKEHFNKCELKDLIIDPLPFLISNKQNHKLYYQLDNHWNYFSGYLTSQLLIKTIKNDFPAEKIHPFPAIEWKDTVLRKGFHYNVLAIDKLHEISQEPIIKNPNASPVKKYGFKPIEGFAYPDDYEIRYLNHAHQNGLTILFINDSFGKKLMPFVSQVFDESVFIFDAWQYKLNEDIIQTVKPNIVVYLTHESNIENILDID